MRARPDGASAPYGAGSASACWICASTVPRSAIGFPRGRAGCSGLHLHPPSGDPVKQTDSTRPLPDARGIPELTHVQNGGSLLGLPRGHSGSEPWASAAPNGGRPSGSGPDPRRPAHGAHGRSYGTYPHRNVPTSVVLPSGQAASAASVGIARDISCVRCPGLTADTPAASRLSSRRRAWWDTDGDSRL